MGAATGRRGFLGFRAREKAEREDGGSTQEGVMRHIAGPSESIVCVKYDLTEARPHEP